MIKTIMLVKKIFIKIGLKSHAFCVLLCNVLRAVCNGFLVFAFLTTRLASFDGQSVCVCTSVCVCARTMLCASFACCICTI